MNTKKFWEAAWTVGIFGWMTTTVVWTMSTRAPSTGEVIGLALWVASPIIWTIFSGFILNDMYGYYLGWRREHYGPENEYVRNMDTTPAKRITLQWLAPFVAIYFLLSGKEKYKEQWIS